MLLDSMVQRSRRLFLIPVLTSFLNLAPIIGTLFWLTICFWWYVRNQDDIHAYFSGEQYDENLPRFIRDDSYETTEYLVEQEYEQNEISGKVLKEFR